MQLSELLHCTLYRITQNFGSRKAWWITVQKHFGRKNIGGLAALHSKSARIKLYWQIKFWWIGHKLPNMSKFSTAKVLCYTVLKRIDWHTVETTITYTAYIIMY